jgi:hypothetical protein
MIKTLVPFTPTRNLLALIICLSAPGLGQTSQKPETLHARHILGFEGIHDNQNGDLSILAGVLRFQTGQSVAQIKMNTIRDVYLGRQDEQIGGTAMTLGRAAAPYGGGRVIALFAHKQYGIVTLEYRASNGALHGAIFQLNNGDAQDLKEELEAAGARVDSVETQSANRVSEEDANAKK